MTIGNIDSSTEVAAHDRCKDALLSIRSFLGIAPPSTFQQTARAIFHWARVGKGCLTVEVIG
jgi:hypothetical protein